MLVQKKNWYQSKAVWGGIIAIVSGILGLFGKTISPEDQSWLADQAVQISTAVVSIAGAGLAIYGRFKADKRIK